MNPWPTETELENLAIRILLNMGPDDPTPEDVLLPSDQVYNAVALMKHYLGVISLEDHKAQEERLLDEARRQEFQRLTEFLGADAARQIEARAWELEGYTPPGLSGRETAFNEYVTKNRIHVPIFSLCDGCGKNPVLWCYWTGCMALCGACDPSGEAQTENIADI